MFSGFKNSANSIIESKILLPLSIIRLACWISMLRSSRFNVWCSAMDLIISTSKNSFEDGPKADRDQNILNWSPENRLCNSFRNLSTVGNKICVLMSSDLCSVSRFPREVKIAFHVIKHAYWSRFLCM
jgi:hypothetical protein